MSPGLGAALDAGETDDRQDAECNDGQSEEHF
jgi:hypothetical protein